MYIEKPHQHLAIVLPLNELHIDPVLNVPDRFGLGTVLEQVQQQIAHHPLTASYFVLGIDRMRLLQQVYGAETSHAILYEAAQLLKRHCADRSHLCWMGGDMFAVVTLHDKGAGTAELASDILAKFRDHEWPLDAHVTVSIGAVALDGQARMPQVVIAAGESALREAKQSGRNRYHIDEAPSGENEDAEALMTARQVQIALRRQSLYLVFQPVVCSRSGQVLFYEALVRMKDKTGQPVPAAQFMPAVEKFGLSFLLDCHVLALAVAELRDNPGLQLAINITATTSENPDWQGKLEKAFANRRDLAARLIIEITETERIRDMTRTRAFVNFAQNLGGQVAIDDFGAGHTSVQYLTNLPVQLMKIDRALVRGVQDDPQQQDVLRAVIALARSLGLRIVAEGVEDAGAAAWLRAADVDMQQGYHHGYPLPDRPWLAA